MKDLKIGSKVKFVKKGVEVGTEIPLGSIGILCDKDDGILNHYVIFHLDNGERQVDWFTRNEFELVNE